jgi:hypothetical protein
VREAVHVRAFLVAYQGAHPHCKEVFMTAQTMHEIERIRTHRRSFAKRRRVPVAAFA